jgi:hypothetical protein
MSVSDEHPDHLSLLDLHLGHLDPTQAAEWRARIAEDPELAREDKVLAGLLQRLEYDRHVDTPTDITGRIMARIAEASQPAAAERVIPFEQRKTVDEELAPGMVVAVRNLRDVLAIAAMIVLAVGLGVPSLLRLRNENHRIGCSANLAQIGQGLAAYANVFNDSLPFAGWPRHASWQPSNEPGVVPVPNRTHVYRLLRVGVVRDPARFVCPSQWDVPMPADEVSRYDNFAESRNVSYAYQNMAGVKPHLGERNDQPILADDNPLFDDGLPLGFRYGSGANSRAHGGDGQNILTLDGRVKWVTTPNCGVNGDNIWTLQGVSTYTGREGPQTASDTHLLK